MSATNHLRAVLLIGAIPATLSLLPLLAVREQKISTSRVSNFQSAPSKAGKSFYMFLAAVTLFTLGNASDTFVLLRIHQLGISTAALPLVWFTFNTIRAFFLQRQVSLAIGIDITL